MSFHYMLTLAKTITVPAKRVDGGASEHSDMGRIGHGPWGTQQAGQCLTESAWLWASGKGWRPMVYLYLSYKGFITLKLLFQDNQRW